MTYDLSVIIPARNEMFLRNTVDDLIMNKRGNTEIIVWLDGKWANPGIQKHDDVSVIYSHVSVGQRAAMNRCVYVSSSKYIMKVDAHCSFDEGFDVKMIAKMKDNYTMAPIMYNLHVFDWVCNLCGFRKYQGPTPEKCEQCGSSDLFRDIVWITKRNPRSSSYRFDRDLHFQYWKEYSKRCDVVDDLSESMSLQGSCFMLTRERYLALNMADEKYGSWGQQGTEVACKTWLSGGRVVINHSTWYGHMFRTQGGDFGFPYPLSSADVAKARDYSKFQFLDGNWEQAVHPLSWLIEKFSPVPDWE